MQSDADRVRWRLDKPSAHTLLVHLTTTCARLAAFMSSLPDRRTAPSRHDRSRTPPFLHRNVNAFGSGGLVSVSTVAPLNHKKLLNRTVPVSQHLCGDRIGHTRGLEPEGRSGASHRSSTVVENARSVSPGHVTRQFTKRSRSMPKRQQATATDKRSHFVWAGRKLTHRKATAPPANRSPRVAATQQNTQATTQF
jgi:hypothetical protein